MTTKQMKILIAVMIVLIVRILWYSQWKAWEETYVEPVSLDVTDINVGDIEEEKSEAEVLIEKVDSLVEDESISEAIVTACMKHQEDYKLCIKNLIGVSNAESGIFKKGMKPSNNGFGRMYQWKKRKFSSVEDSVYKRVQMYTKNHRENRTTWADWLKWKYCTSECSYWIKNYDYAIKKLSLD